MKIKLVLIACITVIVGACFVIPYKIMAYDENDYSAFYYRHDNGIWYEFRTDWQELSDWDSVEELETFLERTDLPLIITSGEPLNNQCENMAFQLRGEAYKYGKRLETEILTKQECIKYADYLTKPLSEIKSMPDNNSHVICKAVIGNEWWYVEPSNDNIWLAYYLD